MPRPPTPRKSHADGMYLGTIKFVYFEYNWEKDGHTDHADHKDAGVSLSGGGGHGGGEGRE